MTAGERFKNWIDGLAESWKDLLRGWLLRTIGEGLTKTLEDMEPGAIASFKGVLTKLKDDPLTPPEMAAFYAKALEPGNWLTELVAGMVMAITSIPALLGAGVPLGNIMAYVQDRELKSARFDATSVITAWRRDPEKYVGLFDDLRDQGWSDDSIEALKFLTLFMPSAGDIVSWYAREVYEPDMVERYGLDSELPAYEGTDFPKIGVDAKQARNYWMAHWVHASYMQIREMLHRGVLSLDKTMPTPPTTKAGWAARDAEGIAAAYDWYRLVEIPPFWRARLTEMMFEIPTRVDVRRFWDMRTIDEARLRSIYHAQGYHGEDLEDYILWTKVYTAFPDLMARWKNGWITLDEVKAELIGLGMPAARVDEMIQTKIKAATPERTATERDITKTDIVKGVKTNVISRTEGVELLVDMGYDEDEAVYILEINIPPDEEDVVVAQRELTKADILKGLKEEVITRDEARERLLDLRYSPADAEFLLKIFDAQVKPPVEPAKREASKADIILAVKKGLITSEDAYLMLQDIGFTPEAADFILMVKAEESPFSPINFAEFKDLTQKYRRAAGMEAVEMPEEIKQAAAEVVKLTGERDALTRAIEKEQRGLVDEEIIPEETTKRLKGLQVKRNRAESKLSLAKGEYDRLVAEWKHAAP